MHNAEQAGWLERFLLWRLGPLSACSWLLLLSLAMLNAAAWWLPAPAYWHIRAATAVLTLAALAWPAWLQWRYRQDYRLLRLYLAVYCRGWPLAADKWQMSSQPQPRQLRRWYRALGSPRSLGDYRRLLRQPLRGWMPGNTMKQGEPT